jgi:hypothetical protein
MGGWFRSRVGVAIIGAIVLGSIAAAIGANSLAHHASPVVGAVAQNGATATAGSSATAESSVTPGSTASATASATGQPTATTAPTVVVPTPTPLSPGSVLRGTVSGAPGTSSFVVARRNTPHYTIQVDGATTYSSSVVGVTVKQLSDLQGGYSVSVTIRAVTGSNTYLASNVVVSDT